MAPVDEILIAAGPGERRLALIAGGRAVEFVIDRGDPGRGDVLLGRVVAALPAIGAALVEIGGSRPGFLARAGGASEGAAVAVRVTAAARRDKGAALVLAPDVVAPDGAAVPSPLRVQAALAQVLTDNPGVRRVLVDDAAALVEARRLFPAATLYRGGPLFDLGGAAEALEEALAPRLPLAGGAALVFAETAGGCVVDVDAGATTPGDANRAAVAAVARQLRLRGIGGHVLIDLIPGRDRRATYRLAEALRRAVAEDPTPAQVAGVTPLGMIELVRERRRPSLAETMLALPEPAPNADTAGLEGLRALVRECEARPGAHLALAAAEEVLAALGRRPGALAEAARRLGRAPLLLRRAGVSPFAIVEVPR